MPGFNNFNPAAWHRMPIAGGDQTAELASPVVFDRLRHCRRSFSRTHHNGAAARRLRQIGRYAALR
jgi:hypothetical protein